MPTRNNLFLRASHPLSHIIEIIHIIVIMSRIKISPGSIFFSAGGVSIFSQRGRRPRRPLEVCHSQLVSETPAARRAPCLGARRPSAILYLQKTEIKSGEESGYFSDFFSVGGVPFFLSVGGVPAARWRFVILNSFQKLLQPAGRPVSGRDAPRLYCNIVYKKPGQKVAWSQLKCLLIFL